jgi:hypothetical protein
MNIKFKAMILTIGLIVSTNVYAASSIPFLIKILAKNTAQLYEMYKLVKRSRDTYYLINDLNRGINDTIETFQSTTVAPTSSLYGNWISVGESVSKLEKLYGKSSMANAYNYQKLSDINSAEAIVLNNSLKSIGHEAVKTGIKIQQHSKLTSPKGAAKQTAQGVGVIVSVLGESLKAQAEGLKLQAQDLSNKNKRDKDETRHFLRTTKDLSHKMKTHKSKFNLPRF